MAPLTVIRNPTLDSDNPYELGKFWEQLLGWPMDPECAPGDGEVLLHGPEGMPGLLLIEVPERKSAKSRMHFDLQPQSTRDEELARVLALGAKVVEDHRKADGAGWVWCEDPEGWAYDTVALDAFSRLVLGWSIADHLRNELACDALDMATLAPSSRVHRT